MPISSLIVQAKSGFVDVVAHRLKALPELEITPGQGDHLVVVAETADRKHDRDVYSKIEETADVVAVNLIYVNFEDMENYQ